MKNSPLYPTLKHEIETEVHKLIKKKVTPWIFVSAGLPMPESGLSFLELASRLNKSESAVKRAARKLRASGRLQRVGPAKGSHWQVLE